MTLPGQHSATIPITSERPASAGPSRLVFAGLAIGNFLVLLDTSILNVALPDVQRDLQASATALPWTVVAYTITFSGLLLAAGALSDRFGAKRVYRRALLAFGLLSLGCAAVPTVELLIAARVLLGAAAAFMVPASIALLASMFPDPAARARAIGTWAAVTSSGLLFGPVLGGLLVTASGWRLVFLVNPPIALVALLLSRRASAVTASAVRPLDIPGIGLSIVMLTALTFGLIQGGTHGWSQPVAWIALTVAAVAAAILVAVERRVSHPVLPAALVARRDITASIAAAAVATLVFYGVLYTLTLWLQRELELTPLQTGLSFVPMTLPMCILPVFAGRLVARYGAPRVILVGLALDVVAGALLFGATSTGGALGWIIGAEIALVLASTTVIPAATAHVAMQARGEIAGVAQGALNAGRQAGSALGVAVLGPLAGLSQVGAVLCAFSVAAIAGVAAAFRTQRRATSGA
ncbi:MFS transporter [Angustibacter sp. McL0619]|uniref:MFS transporter n=1 Tax=Angustibacter sp. McL0619 TaxID=3415676 RepID=UPI003CF1FCD8